MPRQPNPLARLAAPLLALVLAPALTLPAAAQEDRRPSHCIAIADRAPGLQYLHKASFAQPLEDHTVRLNYVAHSMFLIETPGGLTAATDFTGFLGSTTLIPDVVTMNHAHSTHYTDNPDPAIEHPLRGWGDEFGEGVDHYLDLGEMLVRNVSTDIRSPYGGGEEPEGNSVFIFEVGGLCIGHLGHLHHEPTDQQYAAMGRLDVVMAAVDGSYTVDQPTMIRILQRLKSSVVLPMHWFAQSNLERFVAGMSDDFAIERPGRSWVEVSLRNLPDRPTVMILQPELLRDPD